MQAKLKEMVMVVRPTSGNGLIPIAELDSVLEGIGFDFIPAPKVHLIREELDDHSGFFNQDALIEILLTKYVDKYTSGQNLKEAMQMFDYDNDGRISLEEFEYFMRNFGEGEKYIDEEKLKKLLECAKPLDKDGNVVIDTFVRNVNSCWNLRE